MSDKKSTQKLNIDLDFLDVKSEKAIQRKKRFEDLNEETEEPRESKTLTRNTYLILGIVGFVILALILGSQSGNSSGSNAPAPTSQTTTRVGDYNCSSSAATAADTLRPKSTEKSYLDGEEIRLNTISSQLTAERNRLDSEYVNQYSQSSLDLHNNDVDAYNSKLQRYKSDMASYNIRIDTYNAAIKSYNTYLVDNCTKN